LNFLDEAVIHVRGGRGGNGCVAFRREKFVPRGGPSGGDGGGGGDVYLVGDEGLNTLYHLRRPATYEGERGRHGEGSNCTGRSGSDFELTVPIGTQVYLAENGELLGEILHHGQRLTVAAGGRGGRGNVRFKTNSNKAPRRHDPGEEGEDRQIRLELKLLADVGVVGLPNAGKSTFISRVSAARPKIADYPFTTLVPQLGVVGREAPDMPFVIADLPGLIAGAALGAGLGHRFLRHVERCRVLLHLVDLASTETEVLDDLTTIEGELRAFDPELLERTRILVGTKIDARDTERSEALHAAAKDRDIPYFEISSASGEGVAALVHHLGDLLQTIGRSEFDEWSDEDYS
jgi:GTP-binding protein